MIAPQALSQTSPDERTRYYEQYQDQLNRYRQDGRSRSSGAGFVGISGPRDWSHFFKVSVRSSEARAAQVSLNNCRQAGYSDCIAIATASNQCIGFATGYSGREYRSSGNTSFDAAVAALRYCDSHDEHLCEHRWSACVNFEEKLDLAIMNGDLLRPSEEENW